MELALVSMLALAGTAVLTPPRGVKAQEPGEQEKSESRARKLEGTWHVQVTLRDCQTGAEIRTLQSLFTFAQGGTSSGTTAGTSPALQGPGHGIWRYTGGHTYSAVSEAFLFDTAGIWTGTLRLKATIEIRDNPDVFHLNSSNEILDTNGNLLFAGCNTAVGRRFE